MNFIKEAIKEAKIAYQLGEVPVGAVVVHKGEIIGRGHNLKETLKDVTEHAEIQAIKEAAKAIGDWRLNGCELYVTLEPCPMCAGAIIQSRMEKVYIGYFNKDMGACGSVVNLMDNRNLNTFVEVQWLYNEECSSLLTSFFEKRRKNLGSL